MSEPIFKYHVFCCTTRRPDDSPHPSCGQKDSQDLAAYLKDKVNEAELEGVRINPSACLGRCDKGPAVVVYPQGTWYQVGSTADMDEVFESHLKGGQVVDRLLMDR